MVTDLAKLQASRATQEEFEETETVLVLAPASQVAWARAQATRLGGKARLVDLRAAVLAAFPKDPHGMHLQIHLILLQILMGDIVGAMRAYAILMARDAREFTRALVTKLEEVRRSRSQVIQNFARTKPPRAYEGADPSQSARAQDKAQRYTQFVQMNTQLMNELQNNERELVDLLQSHSRSLRIAWDAYYLLQETDFRPISQLLAPSS